MTDPVSTGFIVTQIAGAFFGYLAGRSKDKAQEKWVKKKYEYDLKLDQFTWEEVLDQYAFNKETVDLATWNMAQERAYKERSLVDQWVYKEKMRHFDYDNKVQSYNASVKASKQQLKNVDAAYAMALNSHKRQYQDKIDLLGFQLADLELSRTEKRGSLLKKREQLKEQATAEKQATKYQKQKIVNTLEGKKRELGQKLEESKLSTLQAQGKAQNLGRTGRSAKKTYGAILSERLRAEDMLFDSYANFQGSARLDIDNLNAKLKSAGRKLDLDNQQVVADILTVEKRDKFGTDQVYKSIQSANLQKDWDAEKLKMDKYEGQIQAHNLIKAKPVETPQMPKPKKLPVPKLQKPRVPRRGIKPIEGESGGGSHGLAAIGTGISALGKAFL